VILSKIDAIATKLGVTWTAVPKGGAAKGGGKPTLGVKFTIKDGEKDKVHMCDIIKDVEDSSKCPSCHQSMSGGSTPHNVIPQTMWNESVNDALAAVGGSIAPVTELQTWISGLFKGPSGAHGEGQKQCPHCETPGRTADKHGPHKHGVGETASLIQRVGLPGAQVDDSIVGKQFGGTTTTDADAGAITRTHIQRVVSTGMRDLNGMVRNGKAFTSDANYAPVANNLAAFEVALRAAALRHASKVK
jgi:hypothetical protein